MRGVSGVGFMNSEWIATLHGLSPAWSLAKPRYQETRIFSLYYIRFGNGYLDIEVFFVNLQCCRTALFTWSSRPTLTTARQTSPDSSGHTEGTTC